MGKAGRRTFSWARLVFVVGLAAMVMAGCGGGGDKAKSVAPIKVVLLAPLTGPSATWGKRSSDGFKLAAEIYNGAGGIKSMNGRKIEAVVVDTETKPEVASSQAEKLVQDKDVLVLSGCNQSASTLVATQVCERNKVPFVSHSDTDPTITSRDFKYTFRSATLMPNMVRTLIECIKELSEKAGVKPKKFAALSMNSMHAKVANEAAVKVAQEFGWEIVDNSLYDPQTTKDFTGYISKYKNAKVDILLCDAGTEDAILITRTMKELDFNPMCLGGMYGAMPTSDYWNPLGKDANYVIAVAPFSLAIKAPGLPEVMAKYEEKYKEKCDDVSLLGFNAFAVISKAIDMAGAADREKVREALTKIDMKMGENNLYQFEGVKFAPNGDNQYAKGVVISIKDGKADVIYPKEYVQGEAKFPRPKWKEIK
jgi:branched-chain amino acid transport system substrate-binding protein